MLPIANTRALFAGAFLLTGAPLFTDLPATSLTAPLAKLASAAHAAESVQVTDIRIAGEVISLDIPLATVEGSNLSGPELKALFTASPANQPLTARLAALVATRVSIPELIITTKTGNITQVTRYLDVELRDIAKGIIARSTAARSVISETTIVKDEKSAEETKAVYSGTTGAVTMDTVDIVLSAELLSNEGAATAGDRPTRLLHGPFSISDYRMTQRVDDATTAETGPLNVAFTIETIEGKGISARMPRRPLSELLNLLEAKNDDYEDLSNAEKRTLLTGISDILSSFDFDESTARNINVEVKGEQDGTEFSLNLDSIGFSYVDQELDFSLDKLAASGRAEGSPRPSTASLGKFTISDLSFKPTIAAIDSVAEELARPESDKKDGSADEANAIDSARFAPSGGRVALADLDVKIDPAEDNADPVAFSVKSFETTTGGHVSNGVSSFETELTDLTIQVPDEKDDDLIGQLRALGYKELTLSSVLRGNWDSATKRLTVDTLSLSGVDVGSVVASARLNNVSEQAYSGDLGLTLLALEQAALANLTLVLEDGGLHQRFVQQQVAQGGGSKEEITQQYAALATLSIPALLGDTPVARQLATAASRFISGPGKLTITAKARNPEGVPLPELSSGAPPAVTLQQFDIEASN